MRCGFAPLLLMPSVLLSAPSAAEGQARLTLDVRGGVSVPSGSFETGPLEGGSIDAGPAFGLHFALRRNRWLDLYAGFSQTRFGCEEDGCAGAGDLVSTVWDLGFQVRPNASPWGPWLRVGVVVGGTEIELPPEGGDSGVVEKVTDLGVGGEFGLGWHVRLADAFGLSPGVRYTHVNQRLDSDVTFRMRYWVADLGFILGF
jgi:hypothetical protein